MGSGGVPIPSGAQPDGRPGAQLQVGADTGFAHVNQPFSVKQIVALPATAPATAPATGVVPVLSRTIS